MQGPIQPLPPFYSHESSEVTTTNTTARQQSHQPVGSPANHSFGTTWSALAYAYRLGGLPAWVETPAFPPDEVRTSLETL